ncbi:MAG TPA: hydantoinase/oxoprolinase family protein [Baekduia sp.]|jgi:N-methylhydantoinase A|nr:hydantoinase/oxoprolinase family protein [Baekduia sp.]
MRLGVDIGGTFTDLVLSRDGEQVGSWKVPSTPPEFSQGVRDGVAVVARAIGSTPERLLGELDEFVHGTTVTTNIVLTRTGERVGLLTTRGFGDLYEVARQYRGHEQDPATVVHPVPLVPRADIEEVAERIDFRGDVVLPLDLDGLRASVRRLLDKGIRSFAVCFLWSFRNSEHEQRAKDIIYEEAPDAYVAASFEACPLIGEYERLSTTAITAYTGPALRNYATRLENELREGGFRGSLLLMKSDGGLGTIESAVRSAAGTIYSGPVAGVTGAVALGKAIGEPNLITFDMGGTSTDVGLIHQGQVRTTSLQFLDRQALATPMVDVTTVGAGGGSIGWTTPGGLLRVGPASAGALPGAACYGRGGMKVTVTDANLVLGLLDPDNFLGGSMVLDRDAAEQATDALAEEVGLSRFAAASGMFRVVGSVMADAIRLRTVFAGLDPRAFTLVSFGGAGGLHAASVAQELGVRSVFVPRTASVFSAAGLISTDVVYTFASSTHRTIGADRRMSDVDMAELNAAFAGLDARVQEAFDAHGLPPDRREVVHEIDLSYSRQILDFDLRVASGVLTADGVDDVLGQFDRRYAEIYGVGAAAPETGYDVKTYRVTGIGRIAPEAKPAGAAPLRAEPEPSGHRVALPSVDSAELVEIPVYAGGPLVAGAAFDGPAIVEYDDTTILVPTGWHAIVDPFRNLRLEAS